VRLAVENSHTALGGNLLGRDIAGRLRGYILSLYSKLIPVKAIAPDLGGEGELDRALLVEDALRELGLRPTRVDAKDERAKGGVRPNILALVPGELETPRVWIVAHIDTVPEGDPSLWRYPPYEATVVDDRVYGRGAEDDLQGVVEALGLVYALRELGLRPTVPIGLAFVSDEEAGSHYGLRYLLERNVWGRPDEDWFIVPDAGSSDGSVMLVAEKHILWMKVTVYGRQGHASMPDRALNALRHGMRLALLLDEALHKEFTEYDDLFDPPVSTFEPTRKPENVQNINTIPGVDTLFWDNRVLPSIAPERVEKLFKAIAYNYASMNEVRVNVETVARDEAGSATPPNHPLVEALAEAVKATRGVKPRPRGIGGGTVARYLRRRGYPAVVWMTCDETAHQPNEYARLSYIVRDIETLLYFYTSHTWKKLQKLSAAGGAAQ